MKERHPGTQTLKSRPCTGGRRSLEILVLLACLISATVLTCRTASAGWELVFHDNFDGSELDRSAWYTRYVYNNGKLDTLKGEAQVYRDGDHHVLADGVLSLVATHAPKAGRKHKFESGMIRSRMTFRYGYFESRIKVPSGKALHAAFWLNSDYDETGRLTWPPEIDILETAVNGTTEQPNMMHSGLIIKNKKKPQDGTWLYSDPEFNRKWSYYPAPFDLSQDWHVYGLLWEPDDTVTMYFDGKMMWKRKYRWVYNDGAEAGPAHILFNLAVGGAWAGVNGIDKSIFPVSLQIDYVRVCQRSTEPSASKLCDGSDLTPE